MDDLSEREQIERIRQWWRENGWYIVGGIVLGVLLLTGWNQYQAYQERRAEQAAALRLQLADAVRAGNAGTAADLLATLRADHRASPHTAHGALLLARLQMRQNRPRDAAATLRDVVESGRERDMVLLARHRLARVLAYLEDYEEALAVLVVDEPGEFAARYHDVRGDIYVAMGDRDAAREAYMQALIAPGADLVDRTFLQIKLNDLAAPGTAPLPVERTLPGQPPMGTDAPAPGELPLDDVLRGAQPGDAALDDPSSLEDLPGAGSVLDNLPSPGDVVDDLPGTSVIIPAAPDAPAETDAPDGAEEDGS